MRIVETKTKDGIYFKGLLSEPENTPSKGIIIHIHGMAGGILSNSYYQPMHQKYSENGWAFLAVENRGTGSITEFNSNRGWINLGNALERFEDCVKDIEAWVEFTKELGYENIWLQSHSLGTSKTAYYAEKTDNKDISGMIFLSPSDMLGLVRDPEGKKDHDILFPEAKELVNKGKGETILSHLLWGSIVLSANTYLNFFDDNSSTGIFNYYKPEDNWTTVSKIKVPVLAITGTADDGVRPVMDPYKAMELLKTKLINSPDKKTFVFKNAYHNFDGFEEEIINNVLSFIKKKAH